MKHSTFIQHQAKYILCTLAMLVSFVGTAWGDGATIGNTNYSSGWWTEFSSYTHLKRNETIHFSFNNYGDGKNAWDNWVLVAANMEEHSTDANSEYSEYFVMRADYWAWGSSWNGGTAKAATFSGKETTDRTNYLNMLKDGAKVNTTVSFVNDVITVIATATSITDPTGSTYTVSMTSDEISTDVKEVVLSHTVQNAYLTNYTSSKVATLSSITYNGNTITPTCGNYIYSAKSPCNIIPTVKATSYIEGATIDIAQPTSMDGTATIQVSADGYDDATYTVNFSASESTSEAITWQSPWSDVKYYNDESQWLSASLNGNIYSLEYNGIPGTNTNECYNKNIRFRGNTNNISRYIKFTGVSGPGTITANEFPGTSVITQIYKADGITLVAQSATASDNPSVSYIFDPTETYYLGIIGKSSTNQIRWEPCNAYTINTSTAAADGTISIADAFGNKLEEGATVAEGTKLILTAHPADEKAIDSWSATGTTGTYEYATYTIEAINANTTVSATFKNDDSELIAELPSETNNKGCTASLTEMTKSDSKYTLVAAGKSFYQVSDEGLTINIPTTIYVTKIKVIGTSSENSKYAYITVTDGTNSKDAKLWTRKSDLQSATLTSTSRQFTISRSNEGDYKDAWVYVEIYGTEKQIPAISNFKVEGVYATIDQDKKIITATVPYGTSLTSLKPEVELGGNATTYSPDGEQDFSSAVTYTATDKDGNNTTYNVTLTVADPSSDATASLTLDDEAVTTVDEDANSHRYTKDVSSSTAETCKVAITPNESNATVTTTLNGETQESSTLEVTAPTAGNYQKVDYVVKAQDGETTQTYTIILYKQPTAQEMTGSLLAALKPSTGTPSETMGTSFSVTGQNGSYTLSSTGNNIAESGRTGYVNHLKVKGGTDLTLTIPTTGVNVSGIEIYGTSNDINNTSTVTLSDNLTGEAKTLLLSNKNGVLSKLTFLNSNEGAKSFSLNFSADSRIYINVYGTYTPMPEITTQPESQEVAAGVTAKLTVVAKNATSYQWYKTDNETPDGGTAISGATEATYSYTPIVANLTRHFYCVVSNSTGNVTSSLATITSSTENSFVVCNENWDPTSKEAKSTTNTFGPITVIGSKLETKSKEINEYTAITIPTNKTITFEGQDITSVTMYAISYGSNAVTYKDNQGNEININNKKGSIISHTTEATEGKVTYTTGTADKVNAIFIVKYNVKNAEPSINVTPEIAEIEVGEEKQITTSASLGAQDYALNYSYKSSSTSVAKVSSDGKISAVAPGIATITVTAPAQNIQYEGLDITTTEVSKTITVTVTSEDLMTTTFKFPADQFDIKKGGNTTQKATAYGCTVKNGETLYTNVTSLFDVTYISANENIATINEKGKIVGVAEGSCYVYALFATQTTYKDLYNPGIATALINVKASEATALTAELASTDQIEIDLSTDNKTAQAYDLTSVKAGSTELIGTSNYRVDYESADWSIATVDKTSGLITGRNVGTTTIIVNVIPMEGGSYEADYLTGTAEITVKVIDPTRYVVAKDESPKVNEKITKDNKGVDGIIMTYGGWTGKRDITSTGGAEYKIGTETQTDKWDENAKSDAIGSSTSYPNAATAKNSGNPTDEELQGYPTNSSTANQHNVPCHGAFLMFEPIYDGKLEVHTLQSGIIGEKDGLYKSGRQMYVIDETGQPVTTNAYPDADKDIITPSKYSSQSDDEATAEWKKLCEAVNNATGTSYVVSDLQGKANRVFKLNNGWASMGKGIITYTFDVKAGKKYYMFVRGSKLGLYGFKFTKNKHQEAIHEYEIAATTTETTVTVDGGDDITYTTTNANNTLDPFAEHDGQLVKITSFDRGTFKADTWNTIVLPYSLNDQQVSEIFGEDADVIYFNGMQWYNADNYIMNFYRHYYRTIAAGVPCLVKPSKEVKNIATTASTFPYVTMTGKPAGSISEPFTPKGQASIADAERYDNSFVWTSTYVPSTIKVRDFYVGSSSGNIIYRENSPAKVCGFKSWLSNTESKTAKLMSTGFILSFDDEDEATSIETIMMDNDGNIVEVKDNSIHNLNGQKVADNVNKLKSLGRGIYIIDGKKYINK